jgi:hypothetical protein
VRVVVSDTNGQGAGYGLALEHGGHAFRGVAESRSKQQRRRQATLLTGAILVIAAAGFWRLDRRAASG